MSVAATADELPLRSGRTTQAAGAVVGALVVLAIAGALVVSLQLACFITVFATVAVVRIRSRWAALVLMWIVWLTAPGVRRVFALSTGYTPADLLALLPYAVTAMLIVVELAQTGFDRRLRLPVGIAVCGLVVGIPVGLLAGPAACVYAAFAYATGVGAMVLGAADGRAGWRAGSLRTVLLVAVPVLAVYGLIQYYSLSSWDALWLTSVEFSSVGSPDLERVRIFSTTNSPGTFAAVAGIALLFGVGHDSRTAAARLPVAVGAAAVAAAFALTYARAAWVCVAAALILLLVMGTPAQRRWVGISLLGLTVLFVALGSRGGAGAALTERATSLGSTGSDVSTQARSSTLTEVLPTALSRPLGDGLGTTGEATRLDDRPADERPLDNGYLSLAVQLGPLGVVLYLAGLAIALRALLERRGTRGPETALGLVGVAFLLLLALSGDVFYGVTAVMLWYLLGFGVGRRSVNSGAATSSS